MIKYRPPVCRVAPYARGAPPSKNREPETRRSADGRSVHGGPAHELADLQLILIYPNGAGTREGSHDLDNNAEVKLGLTNDMSNENAWFIQDTVIDHTGDLIHRISMAKINGGMK